MMEIPDTFLEASRIATGEPDENEDGITLRYGEGGRPLSAESTHLERSGDPIKLWWSPVECVSLCDSRWLHHVFPQRIDLCHGNKVSHHGLSVRFLLLKLHCRCKLTTVSPVMLASAPDCVQR